jgi:hypothetical protein
VRGNHIGREITIRKTLALSRAMLSMKRDEEGEEEDEADEWCGCGKRPAVSGIRCVHGARFTISHSHQYCVTLLYASILFLRQACRHQPLPVSYQ